MVMFVGRPVTFHIARTNNEPGRAGGRASRVSCLPVTPFFLFWQRLSEPPALSLISASASISELSIRATLRHGPHGRHGEAREARGGTGRHREARETRGGQRTDAVHGTGSRGDVSPCHRRTAAGESATGRRKGSDRGPMTD